MATTSNSVKVIRFGVFELDLAVGELRKSGLRMKLQEQPFQVLAALLERPGELVGKEELRKRLWPRIGPGVLYWVRLLRTSPTASPQCERRPLSGSQSSSSPRAGSSTWLGALRNWLDARGVEPE